MKIFCRRLFVLCDAFTLVAGAYGGACYEGGGLNGNQGSNGNYQTSTAQSAANVYRANFNTSGNVNTAVDANSKANGRAVRCIEKIFDKIFCDFCTQFVTKNQMYAFNKC
ncbi:hypothetical protein IJJ08_01885 [bacterium]|nr:hypothetical protein [bacterium]